VGSNCLPSSNGASLLSPAIALHGHNFKVVAAPARREPAQDKSLAIYSRDRVKK